MKIYLIRLNLRFSDILVISFLRFILASLLLIITFGCSFDTKTGIWKNINEQKSANIKLIKLSDSKEKIQTELNSQSIISFNSKIKSNNAWSMSGLNSMNFTGHLQFRGQINDFSKFKFKKIQYNKIKENPLIVGKNYFITIDEKGSILKYVKGKLQWKKNIYEKKRERKKIKNISLGVSGKKIYGADNLGNYYAINMNDGEIVWLKKHRGTFNSQIKFFKDKLFIIDNDNVIWCFSAADGNEVWSFKTKSTFIKSKKRLSLVLTMDSVIFSNSAGDITKLDINTGQAIWIMPTQNTLVQYETNFLEISDIVLLNKNLFFSNNFSKIYSINTDTGILNWIQNINSTIRPVIIDRNLFTISNEGYLIVINSETGKIIRSKYILDKLDEKKREKTLIHGFLIASNKVYITTNLGYLIVCSVDTGNVENMIKISKSELSEPIISDNRLHILTNNAVVVFN